MKGLQHLPGDVEALRRRGEVKPIRPQRIVGRDLFRPYKVWGLGDLSGFLRSVGYRHRPPGFRLRTLRLQRTGGACCKRGSCLS